MKDVVATRDLLSSAFVDVDVEVEVGFCPILDLISEPFGMLDRHMFHTGGLLTGVVLPLLEIVFIILELSSCLVGT